MKNNEEIEKNSINFLREIIKVKLQNVNNLIKNGKNYDKAKIKRQLRIKLQKELEE